jgi:hypothetical protein
MLVVVPVVVPLTTTVAPGSGSPAESVILPEMFCVCAKTETEITHRKITKIFFIRSELSLIIIMIVQISQLAFSIIYQYKLGII